jgi:hypothetical protein
LAAILKILKTKSTTLIDDLFLCQVSKGSAVWSEFNYGGYSYKVSWSLMKGIQFFVNPPFSEMPWSNLMKPCRNIICHVKLCL